MKENYLKSELYNLIKNDSSVFEFIQSGSLDGMWYWDLENIENEWLSPKFWQTLGYDPKEKQHLASEWQDIIFQADLKIAVNNFEKHCSNPNYPYDQIVRYRHKNGSTVWIRCRGLAIRDENGKPIRMLGAHSDVTHLKETERELLRLTNEYEKVFNGTQDSMFLIEVKDTGQFVYVRNNQAHQINTGLTIDTITNKTPQELLGKEVGDIVEKNYQRCVDQRSSITYEEELDLPGGKRLWSTTLTPIMEEGRVSYIVGSANDITERKKLELELERYANYDKLTGLPNRRLFFERLERRVLECERDNKKFALLFIDLDGFKDINDSHGHKIGDEVLTIVGTRLLDSVRRSDTVARMGGDEYTVIIRNVENGKVVDMLVEKIHSVIKVPIIIDSISCSVDASIGMAIFPENGKDSETLLRNADSAMYNLKRTKKE